MSCNENLQGHGKVAFGWLEFARPLRPSKKGVYAKTFKLNNVKTEIIQQDIKAIVAFGVGYF